jgi:hypothetical protein
MVTLYNRVIKIGQKYSSTQCLEESQKERNKERERRKKIKKEKKKDKEI